HVLRLQRVVVVEPARLETAHPAANVGEREDETACEVVVSPPVGEPRRPELVRAESFLTGAARERLAPGCIAEPERAADVLAEPSAGEIFDRARVAVPEHALVESGRALEQLLEPVSAPPRPLDLGRELLVLERDTEAAREELDRADEVDLLDLPDERDRIPALAAAEALERAARRRDDEARRLLRMERAQALVRPALLAQSNVVLDEGQDLGRVLDCVDRAVLDPRH